jgi:hypothetical protein
MGQKMSMKSVERRHESQFQRTSAAAQRSPLPPIPFQVKPPLSQDLGGIRPSLESETFGLIHTPSFRFPAFPDRQCSGRNGPRSWRTCQVLVIDDKFAPQTDMRRRCPMSSPAITTVVKMLETLPETAQNQVVEHLRAYLEELRDDARWERSFEKTRDRLIEKARQARSEIAEGKSEPLDLSRL